jgi:thiol:disulfide interchange protein
MKKILGILFCVLCLFGCSQQYLVHRAEALAPNVRWNQYSKNLLLSGHYSKRPMLIYFHSDKCSACKLMDERTLSNEDIVSTVNTVYLPISIKDTDDDFIELAAVFNVIENNGVTVPTILILSSTNIPQELVKIQGFVKSDFLSLALAMSKNVDVLMRIDEELKQLPIDSENDGENESGNDLLDIHGFRFFGSL